MPNQPFRLEPTVSLGTGDSLVIIRPTKSAPEERIGLGVRTLASPRYLTSKFVPRAQQTDGFFEPVQRRAAMRGFAHFLEQISGKVPPCEMVDFGCYDSGKPFVGLALAEHVGVGYVLGLEARPATLNSFVGPGKELVEVDGFLVAEHHRNRVGCGRWAGGPHWRGRIPRSRASAVDLFK